MAFWRSQAHGLRMHTWSRWNAMVVQVMGPHYAAAGALLL